ncbi:MAG: biopolymer transporter ExbD [Planctomycetota bacterium]|nr:MAG: biopolymer transporter ExbD [Planctomycetota bacterium]
MLLRDDISKEKVKMDLTPMIDVIFLLLIFFMLSAKFKTIEAQIISNLPKTHGTLSASYKDASEIRVFLSWCNPRSYQCSKNPQIGRPVLKCGDPAIGFKLMERNGRPDYNMLIDFLIKQKVEQAGRNAGEGIKVIIDAQPLVPWEHVIKALDAVMSVGIKDVSFAAKEDLIKKYSP